MKRTRQPFAADDELQKSELTILIALGAACQLKAEGLEEANGPAVGHAGP